MNDRDRRLSFRVERLLERFVNEPDATAEHGQILRGVICSSPSLAAQIDAALSSGSLRHLRPLGPGDHASGAYHAEHRMIQVEPDILSVPGLAAFILGHEVQHAINRPASMRAARRFHANVWRAAITTKDYTQVIDDLIQAGRWDEASANIAGWNALVDHVRSYRRRPRLTDIVAAAPWPASDFVLGRGRRTRFFPSISANIDFTIPMSSANIEAVARKYFDKPAVQLALGGGGTADYANYYAAWAVGQAARVHAAVVPDQPMRIDLARLGLSRKLMEESGIDLAGIQQQTYIDASTQPPTRDAFHHTIGTYTYVSPPALPDDRPQNPAREAARLAATGFALPATEAIPAPTLCGSSISGSAAALGVRRRRRFAALPSPHAERPTP